MQIGVNAFSIMMNAQREIARKSLPDLIDEPRNNKERLKNDIIKFLMKIECQWRNSEVATFWLKFCTGIDRCTLDN